MFKKSFNNCSDAYILEMFERFQVLERKFSNKNETVHLASGGSGGGSGGGGGGELDDPVCDPPAGDILQALYLQRIHLPNRFSRILEADHLHLRSKSQEGPEQFKEIMEWYRHKIDKLISDNNFKAEFRECALTESLSKPQLELNSDASQDIKIGLKEFHNELVSGQDCHSIKIDLLIHAMILNNREITPKCTNMLADYIIEISGNFLPKYKNLSKDKYGTTLENEFIEAKLKIFDEDNLPNQDVSTAFTDPKQYILESYTDMKIIAIILGKQRSDKLQQACNNLIYFALLLWTDIICFRAGSHRDAFETATTILHPTPSMGGQTIVAATTSEFFKKIKEVPAMKQTLFSGFCKFYSDCLSTNIELPENYSKADETGSQTKSSILTVGPWSTSPFVEYLFFKKEFNVLSRLLSVIRMLNPSDQYTTQKLLCSSLLFSHNIQSASHVKKICDRMIENCRNVDGSWSEVPIINCLSILERKGRTEQTGQNRENFELLHYALERAKSFFSENNAASTREILKNFAKVSNHFDLLLRYPSAEVVNDLAVEVASYGVDWLCSRSQLSVDWTQDQRENFAKLTEKIKSNCFESLEKELKWLQYPPSFAESMDVDGSNVYVGVYLDNCRAYLAFLISQQPSDARLQSNAGRAVGLVSYDMEVASYTHVQRNAGIDKVVDLISFTMEVLRRINQKSFLQINSRETEKQKHFLNLDIVVISLSAAENAVHELKVKNQDKQSIILLENAVLKLRAALLCLEMKFVHDNKPNSDKFPYLDLSRRHHLSKYVDHSRFFYQFLTNKSSPHSLDELQKVINKCFDFMNTANVVVLNENSKREEDEYAQIGVFISTSPKSRTIETLANFARRGGAIDLKAYTAFSSAFCSGMSRFDKQYTNWLVILDTLFWADTSDSNWRLHSELLRVICDKEKSRNYLVNTSTISPIVRYLTGCVYITNQKFRTGPFYEAFYEHKALEKKRHGRVHSDLNAAITCLLDNNLIIPASELALHIATLHMEKRNGFIVNRSIFKPQFCSPLSIEKKILIHSKVNGLANASSNAKLSDFGKEISYYGAKLGEFFDINDATKAAKTDGPVFGGAAGGSGSVGRNLRTIVKVGIDAVGEGSNGQVYQYAVRNTNGKGVESLVWKKCDSPCLEEIKILDQLNKLDKKCAFFPRLEDHKQFQIDDFATNGLLMEYVPHGTLLRRVKERIATRNYSYSEKDARSCIKSLLSGVQVMHNNNIIHRDLKLANVMMASADMNNMATKIIDFGFAVTLVGSEVNDGKDCTCGTEAYCAPEIFQCEGEDPESLKPGKSGKPADVWALGVILFILLNGHLPFPGTNFAEFKKNVLAKQLLFSSNGTSNLSYDEFFKSHNKTLSPQAQDLIKRMFTFDPKARITVDEALKHNWLTDENIDNDLGKLKDELTLYDTKREGKDIKGRFRRVAEKVINVLSAFKQMTPKGKGSGPGGN